MKKGFILATFLSVLLIVVAPVFAVEPTGTVNLGPAGNTVPIANVTVNVVVRFIINMLVLIAIIASLIFLIYGGIKWVISGGDKEKVETARKTVVSSIIGLVVVLLAWVIITLVLQFLGLGTLSDLNVPQLSPGKTEISK